MDRGQVGHRSRTVGVLSPRRTIGGEVLQPQDGRLLVLKHGKRGSTRLRQLRCRRHLPNADGSGIMVMIFRVAAQIWGLFPCIFHVDAIYYDGFHVNTSGCSCHAALQVTFTHKLIGLVPGSPPQKYPEHCIPREWQLYHPSYNPVKPKPHPLLKSLLPPVWAPSSCEM